MTYSDHFESFWQKYGSDERLAPSKKGPKHTAYKSWQKVCKDYLNREHLAEEKDFAQHVARGLTNQEINRRALRNNPHEHCPFLPHVSTWLNQWRFEQELDKSTGDVKRATFDDGRTCDLCSEPPVGRSYRGGYICRTHYLAEWAEQHRDAFQVRLKSSPKYKTETWYQWSIRTLETMSFGSLLLKKWGTRKSC